MGVSSGILDSSILAVYGTSQTKSAINATEGSLVKFTNKAKVGDIVSFQYDFITDDYTPYADFSFFNIGSTTNMIAGVGTNVANFGSKSGLVTYTITSDDLINVDSSTQQGDFSLSVGVVDALDTYVNSTDIWDFKVTTAGESAPVEDKNAAKLTKRLLKVIMKK